MTDKYKVTLHGKEQKGEVTLHDALMDLHHSLPGIMPSVKSAMDAGYKIEKVNEYKNAVKDRHGKADL